MMVAEELFGLLVVRVAGHDKPRDICFVSNTGSDDLFGKDLKEWFFCYWCDRKCALRPVVAETRALSSGDGEGGYFSVADRLFAADPRIFPGFGLFVRFWKCLKGSWLKVLKIVGRGRVFLL